MAISLHGSCYHFVVDADSVRSVSEFLEEATIMHNFNHENVLSLIGVVIDGNKPYVIMPLMEKGDLRAFIGKQVRKQSHLIQTSSSMLIYIPCNNKHVVIYYYSDDNSNNTTNNYNSSYICNYSYGYSYSYSCWCLLLLLSLFFVVFVVVVVVVVITINIIIIIVIS